MFSLKKGMTQGLHDNCFLIFEWLPDEQGLSLFYTVRVRAKTSGGSCTETGLDLLSALMPRLLWLWIVPPGLVWIAIRSFTTTESACHHTLHTSHKRSWNKIMPTDLVNKSIRWMEGLGRCHSFSLLICQFSRSSCFDGGTTWNHWRQCFCVEACMLVPAPASPTVWIPRFHFISDTWFKTLRPKGPDLGDSFFLPLPVFMLHSSLPLSFLSLQLHP